MPLRKGKSQLAISTNNSELHSGAQYARTRSKFGKTKADKQAIAIALSEARKGKRKRKRNVGESFTGRYLT